MRIRWTALIALAALTLVTQARPANAAPASANDPKALYSAVVDQEIREIPFLLGSDAFVRDYGMLLLCHGKMNAARANAMIPQWRTQIRRRVADERDRYLTAAFQTPLLDYDKQQSGFPLPIVVADDSHDMMFSVQTDVGFTPPWPVCGVPDFTHSALPQHVSIFVANTGVFSVLPVSRNAEPRVRKAMGDAPSATIKAVVKLQSIDFRNNAAAALVQTYKAYPGYNSARQAFVDWPHRGDSIDPLACAVQSVWLTSQDESADKRPYLHARLTLRTSRTITVQPDQFVLAMPFKNGGEQLVNGMDAAAPPAVKSDAFTQLAQLSSAIRDSGAEIPVQTRTTVESDEDLGLSMATTLAPTSGGGYDWIVTFPLTPEMRYGDRIDSLTWDYAFSDPCRPQNSNSTSIAAP